MLIHFPLFQPLIKNLSVVHLRPIHPSHIKSPVNYSLQLLFVRKLTVLLATKKAFNESFHLEINEANKWKKKKNQFAKQNELISGFNEYT